jgi:hypothetical protein
LRQLNGVFGISKSNFENAILHSNKFFQETMWEAEMGLIA